MKKAILLAAATVVATFFGPVFAAPLTPGDLVMYRTGDGVNAVSTTAAPVFIDEYKPDGTLVQSIPMPTVASGSNHKLTGIGNSGSEGQITLSTDGQYLVVTGYDASIGAADPALSSAASVPRVVGRVDLAGNFDTTTTITNAYSGSGSSEGQIRSATSVDGTSFWTSGNSGTGNQGIHTVAFGGSTGTQIVTNATRSVEIFDGQLYTSTTSGSNTRISKVGSGLPTSATTLSGLANIPSSGGSPNQFVFLDLSGDVPGIDTFYYSDDTGQALSKFSLVGGTWVQNGVSVGAGSDDYVGLVALQDGSTVTLFATLQRGASADQLVKLIDTSGYNAAFSSSTPTVLSTASSATALTFHGLAFIPEPSTISLIGLSGLLLLRRKRN